MPSLKAKAPAGTKKWAYVTPHETPTAEMKVGTAQHVWDVEERRTLCGVVYTEELYSIRHREPRRHLCEACRKERQRLASKVAKRRQAEETLKTKWGLRGPGYKK